jgi:tRNA threonylcarbamoyladenosine biosynthesis protein TsaB
LLAIDTLQALAWNMREEAAWARPCMLVPMTDARRMEVYTAVYESQELSAVIPVAPKILEPDDFYELARDYQLVFAGSGAAKWQSLCRWSEEAMFFNELLPDATGMGALAADAFKKGAFADVAYFEPFYLKQFLPGKGSVA